MADLPSPEDRIKSLLKAISADTRPCKECGAKLYFVRLASGKIAPYTEQGINHFIDCSSADQFRRRKHA